LARRWQYLAWTWQLGNELWGEITSEGTSTIYSIVKRSKPTPTQQP